MKKWSRIPMILLVLLLTACSQDLHLEGSEKPKEKSVESMEPIPFQRIDKKVEKPKIEVFANGHSIFYAVPAYIEQYMQQKAAVVSLYPTAKAMGWDVMEEAGVFTVKDKGEVVRFKLNQRVFLHNGDSKRTEIPFKLHDGEVFVPIQALALALGDDVEWNEKRYHLKLKTPPIIPVSIPILVYHDVQYNRYDTLAVDPVRFQEQMALLKENGYTTITERDLLLYLQKEKNLPEKPIMIHFDDGYENTYVHAFPILRELGMKATYYLVGKTVKEQTGDNEPYSTTHLSWEQIKEMQQSGVITFESHTFDLHGNGVSARYEKENDEAYQKRLLEDFLLSKELIEQKLGTNVLSLAYPFGDYNEQADEVAKNAGFALTMTMDEGLVKWEDSPYKLKRIYISGADHGEAFLNKFRKYVE